MSALQCRYCGNMQDAALQGVFAGAGNPLRNVECRDGRACEQRRVRMVIAEVQEAYRISCSPASARIAAVQVCDQITKALKKRKHGPVAKR